MSRGCALLTIILTHHSTRVLQCSLMGSFKVPSYDLSACDLHSYLVSSQSTLLVDTYRGFVDLGCLRRRNPALRTTEHSQVVSSGVVIMSTGNVIIFDIFKMFCSFSTKRRPAWKVAMPPALTVPQPAFRILQLLQRSVLRCACP